MTDPIGQKQVREPTIELDVPDAPYQDVVVQATGPETLLIEDFITDREAVNGAPMPDWVQLLVDAANLGMFGGAACSPWGSRARVMDRKFDASARTVTWEVALHCVDTGIFRVLSNLLRALLLDEVTIRTRIPQTPGPRVLLPRLAYPATYLPTPFPVTAEWTPRPLRDRAVQIVFARKLDTQFVERSYRALETWTTLLLLGAYPTPRVHPRVAAVAPDVAYQLDAFTISQEFPEIFDCDEACFSCVVNWAHAIHHSVMPVESIRIE